MLELVNLDERLSKADYARVFPGLEQDLGECQRAARKAGVPVVIVCEGWDAAGKGSVINRLAQTLDPRGFEVHSTLPPTKNERLHPWMWRFWNTLPAAGDFAMFDRSWYRRVLADRIHGKVGRAECEAAYRDIDEFEQQWIDAGTVIVKFWLHISKKEQRRRFKRLEKSAATAWKVGKTQWENHRRYDEWKTLVEEMLERTSTAAAPWTIVEATQGRFQRTKVFETVLRAVHAEIERRAAAPRVEPTPMRVSKPSPTDGPTILDRLDLSLSLDREEYEQELGKLHKRLFDLEHEIYTRRVPVAIVYEGVDAGGKGGNIKRLTRGLDPRGYKVVPVGPPNPVELAHHYLWRFWREAPKAGHIALFDRSWYGRVLVERVEGLCGETDWRRAYREINEFERQWSDFGTVLVKFWLHIDQDEQLRRFEARQETPYKQWKITDEDWRNRKKWPQYKAAVVEMLERTSTTYAPWTVLEANCKLYARVKAIRTVVRAIEEALAGR
ncbi:MAG TPA: polyphosphate:AMP phosphotransferase [Thermoguttaceae bacterium]|nr:polyphosphate:AMP phosphotransferase [Thermoguttaceae bacterium]